MNHLQSTCKNSIVKVLAVYLACCLSLLAHPNQALAAKVIPGTKCLIEGEQQVFKKKTYTCIKLGKRLFWDNGISPRTDSASDFLNRLQKALPWGWTRIIPSYSLSMIRSSFVGEFEEFRDSKVNCILFQFEYSIDATQAWSFYSQGWVERDGKQYAVRIIPNIDVLLFDASTNSRCWQVLKKKLGGSTF